MKRKTKLLKNKEVKGRFLSPKEKVCTNHKNRKDFHIVSSDCKELLNPDTAREIATYSGHLTEENLEKLYTGLPTVGYKPSSNAMKELISLEQIRTICAIVANVCQVLTVILAGYIVHLDRLLLAIAGQS